MPIALPNLDDRRFEDLVAEGRALLPALSPQWTDHNLSDPGITLIELFAYLAEILIYRLNRVTDANIRAWLQLLNGPGWVSHPDDLAGDVRSTMLALRTPDRAVTASDFVLLALKASRDVSRAGFVAGLDLGVSPPLAAADRVSVVLLGPNGSAPSQALINQVNTSLQARRLLTTRLKVTAVQRFRIGIRLQLILDGDAVPAEVLTRATAALARWLDPLSGGPDGLGWPFGRPVYLSEIHRLLDALAGVDYVEPGALPVFDVVDPAKRLIVNDLGQTIAVKLHPQELPSNDAGQFLLTAVSADGTVLA